MEQFELSFPLADRQNHILIPQLLEDRQPEMAGSFDIPQCLNFGYQYPIVPYGVVTPFHRSHSPLKRAVDALEKWGNP
jgi:hypothetical protein